MSGWVVDYYCRQDAHGVPWTLEEAFSVDQHAQGQWSMLRHTRRSGGSASQGKMNFMAVTAWLLF